MQNRQNGHVRQTHMLRKKTSFFHTIEDWKKLTSILISYFLFSFIHFEFTFLNMNRAAPKNRVTVSSQQRSRDPLDDNRRQSAVSQTRSLCEQFTILMERKVCSRAPLADTTTFQLFSPLNSFLYLNRIISFSLC